MIPREILKQVRLLEITTRGLVNDVFSGEYHSVFKGRGMSFAEVREYRYGDDIRGIDWNVTARTGSPHVKVFEEERELTLMLVVDVSASAHFGTRERMKSEAGGRAVRRAGLQRDQEQRQGGADPLFRPGSSGLCRRARGAGMRCGCCASCSSIRPRARGPILRARWSTWRG